MAKPPVLKPREVVALLVKLGFVEVRQRGSHKQYRHADGRGTTVPFHQGRDISPTSVEDFLGARPAPQTNTSPSSGAVKDSKKPTETGRAPNKDGHE